MNGVVVDTDVLSYVLREDSRAYLYREHLSVETLCVSFATVAELYRWSIARKWGQARLNQLQQLLNDYVVLEYDDAIAWEWARVMSIKGRPVTATDAWIAATAIRHSLPLVTHNRRHFEVIGKLKVLSES